MADIYTPSQLAAEIDAIETGPDTSEDTITAADLAEGITAHDAEGEAITGTMPDLGNVAFGDSPDVAERGYIASEWLEGIAEAINIRVGRANQRLDLRIFVTTISDVQVTAEKDGETYYGFESTTTPGEYAISVPEYGTYTVHAKNRSGVFDIDLTAEVEITAPEATLTEGGYRQLQWIASEGEAATLLPISAPFSVEFEVELDAADQTFYVGGYSNHYSNSNWPRGDSSYAFVYSDKEPSVGIGKKAKVFASTQSGVMEIDGESVSGGLSYGSGGGQDGYWNAADGFCIFGLFGRGYPTANPAYSSLCSGKLYSLTAYKDADKSEVLDVFYPAYSWEHKQAGMYGTISKAFYGSETDTPFIAGPEVT